MGAGEHVTFPLDVDSLFLMISIISEFGEVTNYPTYLSKYLPRVDPKQPFSQTNSPATLHFHHQKSPSCLLYRLFALTTWLGHILRHYRIFQAQLHLYFSTGISSIGEPATGRSFGQTLVKPRRRYHILQIYSCSRGISMLLGTGTNLARKRFFLKFDKWLRTGAAPTSSSFRKYQKGPWPTCSKGTG